MAGPFAIVASMDAQTRADESERQLGELVRLGHVVEVDLATGRCVVELGPEGEALPTAPIPWLAGRAGTTRFWSPPAIGEQVAVISPEGDIERAFVIGALFSDAHPAPADDGRSLVIFADDAVVSYDPDAHRLLAQLPDGGLFDVIAPGGVSILADVAITGDVTVTGQITASVDVVAAGVSLKTHKHSGVQAGGAQTGVPV